MGRETWVNQVSQNEEEVSIIRQRYAEFWKDKSDAMQQIQGFHIRANNHTRVGNVHFILMSEIIFPSFEPYSSFWMSFSNLFKKRKKAVWIINMNIKTKRSMVYGSSLPKCLSPLLWSKSIHLLFQLLG